MQFLTSCTFIFIQVKCLFKFTVGILSRVYFIVVKEFATFNGSYCFIVSENLYVTPDKVTHARSNNKKLAKREGKATITVCVRSNHAIVRFKIPVNELNN